MASWIFGIDKDNPQHWGIAQRLGIWHLTKRVDVRAGDTLYFWQAELPKASPYKSRLVGLMRAITGVAAPVLDAERLALLPTSPAVRPSPDLLLEHHQFCARWLA